MKEEYIIETFSGEWWIFTSIVVSIILIVNKVFRNASPAAQKSFERIFASLIIVFLVSWQIYFIHTGTWDASVSLPFHLCGISKVAAVFLLFKYNQRWFEFTLLLGMGGALQSIMTPQLEVARSTFALVEYYFSHGVIILTPIYLFYVKGHRLRHKSWLYTYFFGLVVLVIVAGINYVVGGNYIYLCEKPMADNPLLIGPWPYYLSGFLGFGFINVVLFYYLFRRWGNKIDRNSSKLTAETL